MKSAEYENMYAVEDTHWWYRGLRAMIRDAWSSCVPKNASRILDVGCGTGATLQTLQACTQAFGADFSMLALERCGRRGLGRLCRADAMVLPYAPGSFDVVLMMDLLYHRGVPDPVHALKEAARVSVDGGVVLLNVPAYQWLHSSHDRAVHTEHRFTRPEVREMARAAGLDLLKATYWNTVLFPAVAAVRLLRKGGKATGSDLEGYREGVTARVCGVALTLERAILRLTTLPFGSSIFAVARKPAAHCS